MELTADARAILQFRAAVKSCLRRLAKFGETYEKNVASGRKTMVKYGRSQNSPYSMSGTRFSIFRWSLLKSATFPQYVS